MELSREHDALELALREIEALRADVDLLGEHLAAAERRARLGWWVAALVHKAAQG